MPTSEGRYLFEFDGVTAIRSSDVSGVSKDHTEFELYESNRPNPNLGRGHFKIGDITVKHGHALNSAGDEVFRWMNDYMQGRTAEKRGGRLILLDEEGQSPVAIYELTNCVPKKFEVETHTAGGNNASYFKFTIRPEDMVLL